MAKSAGDIRGHASRPGGFRLPRGPKHRVRVPLGGRKARSASRIGGRACSPSGRRYRHARAPGHAGGQASHANDSDCLRGDGRSRRERLWNPTNSSHTPALQAVHTVARASSLEVQPLEVRAATELDGTFEVIVREKADGLLFIADPVFFIGLNRMADFVVSSRLPAIANFTEFPKLGGLIGYAPSIPDEFRHAANHIDKILKGAKPADLPV